MQRSKSDRIDAKVIAQFCVALEPLLWQPPPEEQQYLQELMRRLSAVESILLQEKNRQEWANHPEVKQSLKLHIGQLESEIERLNKAIEAHFIQHNSLQQQRQLLVSIPGIAEKTAAHLKFVYGTSNTFN